MWAETLGLIGALVIGMWLARYGWLCISRKQWMHKEGFLFWTDEKGQKVVTIGSVAMIAFLTILGLVNLLVGNWQGAIGCAVCIAAGLVGLSSQRVNRSFSQSFYESLSRTPSLPGVFFLLLGLVFISVSLWRLLTTVHIL